MGNKTKILVILILSVLVYYFFDISDCLKKRVAKSEIKLLLNQGSYYVYGIEHICIKRPEQYGQVIKLFIENDSVKKKQYLFMKITKEVKLYQENNWLKNLDGVEFDKKFQSAKVVFVSLSRLDSIQYEYSWFNSKLSEENKGLEELINEAAAPQLEK